MVDDASEDPVSPHNGTTSPRENGIDKINLKKDHVGPHSPRSGTSSNASTPSTKKMEEKPTTPISKSVTPTSGGSTSSGGAGGSALKPVVKPPPLGQYPYLGAAGPHELQPGAYGALHNHNHLPPGYPRPPIQVSAPGYPPDPHPQMRAPVVPGLAGIPGGKP